MDDSQIRAAVLSALKEIQEMSGREWEPLEDDERIIGGLGGFKSHNGVELTCAIEELLDCDIPLSENLCVEDLPNGRRRARSLNEVVKRIGELTKKTSVLPRKTPNEK